MSRLTSMLMLLVLALGLASVQLFAQGPTGIIEGTITDASGAIVPNATVTITNKATGVVRTATANASGNYSAPALPAGDYTVKVEVTGFRTQVSDATVQVGSDLTVNMALSVGTSQEVVNVEAAAAQVNYESNAVTGVIDRGTIQDLPLNGRSFMQLASLEPGVTIAAGSTAQFNTLFTVSILGAGNRTVFTIDGGNISDNIDVGGGISSMNFSQDMVQEFQLSSVNFDLSTPIAAGGAINIVSRSGSNDFHGSGYFFFRDHNTAAYPNLVRPSILANGQPAFSENPFFARRNPGVWVGGPIIKNKLFFFGNVEYQNQVQAVNIATTGASVANLTGNYDSPYHSRQISIRLDYHLNDKNNIFVRYSHDGNAGFAQSLEFGDPSNWAHNTNWADQAIVGLTTTLTASIVNDLRVQYNYWNNHNLPANSSDCSLPCVAGSLPNIYTFIGTNLPAIGPNFNAPQGRNTRREELVDTLSWQKGSHRFKMGGDLNPTASNGYWGFCTPLCVGAYSPEFLNATYGAATAAALFPFVPQKLNTDADALNLPVYNGNSSIFSGVGVGNVSTPAPYGYSSQKNYNQYRSFFQDTWKVRSNFTINYGLAWDAQTGFYNSNLPKPQFLAPILGSGNLGPTVNNLSEFQPAFGFTWSPFKNGKTVIRGGGGIYWDSTPGYYKLREAPVIGPVGDGRSTLASSAFTNIYPGIFNGSPANPVPIGAPIPVGGLINMSIAQFDALVAQELPAITAKLAPSNPQTSGPYTVSGIDVAKQGVEIYPEHFPLARSYQTSLGFQQELPGGFVLSADWARRLGINTSLGEVDYNLYNRFQGSTAPVPVIPQCAASQFFVPGQECSTGTITFWTDQGRALYDGLLLKLQKRLSHRTFMQASYALQRGYNETVWNDSNWAAGWGQYLAHQNLNVSGYVDLPWGFQLSLNSSIISPTPGTVNLSNPFLAGTVQAGSTEPLPGLQYGCVNAGCSRQDIVNAVNAWNTLAASGTLNAKGAALTKVALPSNFSLGKPIISQDVRVTKTFSYKERYRLAITAEAFNIFNISNLVSPSLTLDNSTATSFAFGQYTQRVGQSLGQGGPRAFQFGGRFSF